MRPRVVSENHRVPWCWNYDVRQLGSFRNMRVVKARTTVQIGQRLARFQILHLTVTTVVLYCVLNVCHLERHISFGLSNIVTNVACNALYCMPDFVQSCSVYPSAYMIQ